MHSVNIHAAKTHLSRLVREVEAGEEVIIQRDGKPVAKIVPFHQETPPRKPGLWANQVHLQPGFDAPLSDDEAAIFYEGSS